MGNATPRSREPSRPRRLSFGKAGGTRCGGGFCPGALTSPPGLEGLRRAHRRRPSTLSDVQPSPLLLFLLRFARPAALRRVHRPLPGFVPDGAQFLQSLPRNPIEHGQWLRITGATPEEQPLSALRPDGFRAGGRSILHKVARPGNTFASPLVRMENGWAGFTQASGLPEFIFARAVQYAASRGVPADVARRQLMPPHLADPAQRRGAPWAIGIVRDSGHAVVLHAGHAHAFGHRLAERWPARCARRSWNRSHNRSPSPWPARSSRSTRTSRTGATG